MGPFRFLLRSALDLSAILGLALFAVPAAGIASHAIHAMSPDPNRARVSLASNVTINGPLPTTITSESVSFPMSQAIVATDLTEPALEELYVVTSGVNVRSGPAKASHLLTMLAEGDVVSVLEREGNWARVAQNAVAVGWVYDRFLAMKQ